MELYVTMHFWSTAFLLNNEIERYISDCTNEDILWYLSLGPQMHLANKNIRLSVKRKLENECKKNETPYENKHYVISRA